MNTESGASGFTFLLEYNVGRDKPLKHGMKLEWYGQTSAFAVDSIEAVPHSPALPALPGGLGRNIHAPVKRL
jgi:hypothetical protein